MTRICSLVLIAVLLSGCAHLQFHYVVRDFCELAPDIKGHRKDTPGTKHELDDYRELYRRRCPSGKWH